MIPEIETKSPDEIQQYQETRLQELLVYLKSNSPFYQELFQRNQIDINQIRTLDHLQAIPTTSKDDLQAQNDAFLCVSKSDIVDYVTTSGTLGDPVTFALTDNDLERLAYNEYLSFGCANGTSNDVFQLMTTIDRRFMAGLAYFLGVRKLGAGIVRVGAGIPELQWDTILRIEPTALIVVPSFILRLLQYAKTHGIDYQNTSIQKAICIGEPIRNADFSLNPLGQQITDQWNIDLFSTYASTEMSTAFTECIHGIGGHHHPELIIVELLDESGQRVPEGTPGEVTVTTLGVEGMPLLRFRTGDICQRFSEPCACGRTTFRLGPVIGRRKQMIKYKGTTLYPPALYNVLNEIPGVQNYLIEVSTNEVGTDEILIRLGGMEASESLEKQIKDRFRAKLRVAPNILFQSADEIQKLLFPPMSRKPVKFVDRRVGKDSFK